MKSAIFVIAEAGVNHNGSLSLAEKLVEAAARSGADAVKFQTFKADKLLTKTAPKAVYQMKSDGQRRTQWEMIRHLELGEKAHHKLFMLCRRLGIEFLSSPFDEDSLDFLIRLGLRKIKIPSGEITNGPLLVRAARSGLPILLSTGMSTLKEIRAALGALAFGYLNKTKNPSQRCFFEAFQSVLGRKILKQRVTLLHCTSEYPAPFLDIHLRAMDTLAEQFGVKTGFSDHSAGIAVAIAAAARGAFVIEKHFTLDRNLGGPDHHASLTPDELAAMVKSVREVEEALGSKQKRPVHSELKNQIIVRKSIVAASCIQKGELFSKKNLGIKRPAKGISPMHYWQILGKKSERNYELDEMVRL